MAVLITGGAGFIGSHTALVLLQAGYQLVILDNFSNSSKKVIKRIKELAGECVKNHLLVIEGDIRDKNTLKKVFSQKAFAIEAVIHFAGLKAVGESISHPVMYWDVNVVGTHNLLQTMLENNCRTIVFSSSATLYGNQTIMPIPETASISPTNPYGKTKAAVEQLLHDLHHSEPNRWRIACLRYFNPVGAHPSGRLGENPQGTPTNLFPFVCEVASGKRSLLKVYGNDWPTKDGSGVRDFIHVMDLAEGHLAALSNLCSESPQLLVLNLGSGKGNSVLDVVREMERAVGRTIPYEITERRPGDVAISIASADRAFQRLNWRTKRGLKEICKDGWAWQLQNPYGYV